MCEVLEYSLIAHEIGDVSVKVDFATNVSPISTGGTINEIRLAHKQACRSQVIDVSLISDAMDLTTTVK